MDTIYIARKYIADEVGARHYYEEATFSSYNRAYEFILDISEEDDDCFLSEIVNYPLNSKSPCDKKNVFTFDRKGKLIAEDHASTRYDNCIVIEENGHKFIYEKHDSKSYLGKYRVGDIVFIKAYPWNEASPTHKDCVGVVSNTPISFEKWVGNGNEEYTWDNTYVVDVIISGYLGHWHVEEKAIRLFENKLSKNLLFLESLSKHYQGTKPLPPEIVDDISSGDLFVENVRHFRFKEDTSNDSWI